MINAPQLPTRQLESRSCRLVAILAIAAMVSGLPGAAAGDDPLHPQQQVGERAHDFDLPRVGSDDYLRLSDCWREGPVVVIMLRGYPGYQCPICTRQVSSLVNRAGALQKMASKVILVYPAEEDEAERRAEQFAGSRRLPEPLVLVRDDGLEVATQWGLRWQQRNETAYPATYVIDRNGRIQWKKVSDSHAGRARVEEILKALRTL